MSTREERIRGIDAAVFRTITGADWAREIARARGTPNAVRAQIQKILARETREIYQPNGRKSGNQELRKNTMMTESTWGFADSTAHDCMEMIRRHAPRMMRAGGGPLAREFQGIRGIPWQKKHEVLRLFRETNLTAPAIGAAVGVSGMSVHNIVRRAGLRFVRDGRRKAHSTGSGLAASPPSARAA